MPQCRLVCHCRSSSHTQTLVHDREYVGQPGTFNISMPFALNVDVTNKRKGE